MSSATFFPDGHLHAQESDGEATMREGACQFKGDKLTIKIARYKSNTPTVAIAGDELLLDGRRYKRCRP